MDISEKGYHTQNTKVNDSPLSSAVIRSTCWRTRGGRSADHLSPAFGRHVGQAIFNDWGMRKMGIRIEAIIADHDLTFVGNMGGDSSDAGKPAHRITAVQVLLDNILDNRTEISVLPLETRLIFPKEPFEIIKEHPVKHRVFRMTLAVDPCHGREDDSRNRPGTR